MLLILLFGYLVKFGLCVDPKCSEELSKWDSEFVHSAYLSEDENYKLHWTANSNNNTIEFGMSACNAEWIGFGFSPGTGMNNADIIMGWLDSNNKPIVQARYSLSKSTPLVRKTQEHIIQKRGEKVNDVLKIRFVYDNGCKTVLPENDDRYRIKKETNRILWAFGNLLNGQPSQHNSSPTNRFQRSINILSGNSQAEPKLEPGTEDFVVSQDRDLTTADTEYICKLFKFPQVNKAHITRVMPDIETGNKGIVHHMILYLCPTELFEQKDENKINIQALTEGKSILCDDLVKIGDLKKCKANTQLANWAVGGNGKIFPEDVGLPFGTETDIQYAVLETHYDNPKQTPNLKDKSGLKLYYNTKSLRKYDAGIFFVGLSQDYQFIPPNSIVTNWGVCSPECTQHFPDEINVFWTGLHSHNVGYQMQLRHVRDNVELKPIDTNDNYDFNYQQSTHHEPPLKLRKNDTLITKCVYDTTKRNKITRGGEGSSEEMCYAFLYYYPAFPMVGCISLPTLTQQKNFYDENKQYTECPKDQTCNFASFTNYNYKTDQSKANYDKLYELPINKRFAEVCSYKRLDENEQIKVTQIQQFKPFLNKETCSSVQKTTSTTKNDNEETVADYAYFINSKISFVVSIAVISSLL